MAAPEVSSFREGEHWYVKYRGYNLHHQRILVGIVDEELKDAFVLTPDLDMYIERVAVEPGGMEVVTHAPDPSRVPAGVGPQYRFSRLSANDLSRHLREGRDQALAERARRGLPVAGGAAGGAGAGVIVAASPGPPGPGGGGAGPALLAPPVPPGPGGGVAKVATPRGHEGRRWRLMESVGDLHCGDQIVPGGSALVYDNRALDSVQGKWVCLAASPQDETKDEFLNRFSFANVVLESMGDARVLPVYTRASDGKRERTWESVCAEVRKAELPHFAVDGPRTVTWCIAYLRRQQMHPEDYHIRWRQRHRLNIHDWGVVQHQLALRTVSIAGCADQLDLPNLAAIEHLMREAQLVEHHYRNQERDQDDRHTAGDAGGGGGAGGANANAGGKKQKGGKGGMPIQEVELFLGAGKSFYECMVAPELLEHVAKLMERDSGILKQSRKAREERALARQ